jgi:hypothetical protein
MARHETCRQIDLPLPVEGIEQSDAERLCIGGQIVRALVAAIASTNRSTLPESGNRGDSSPNASIAPLPIHLFDNFC